MTPIEPSNLRPKTTLYTPAREQAERENPGPISTTRQRKKKPVRSTSGVRHEYEYGIKNLQFAYATYQETGIFVTRPIAVEGNIVEVSLSTAEEHPLFNELNGMATDRVTSVEYYVATEENPSLSDWKAILPEETKVIKSEKLFFLGASAKLRFHADISDIEQTRVYKNSLLLGEDEWYFTERGAAIQLATSVDQNSMYTIDYVPNTDLANPWKIDVPSNQSKRVRQVDRFSNGTDSNNTIKLSKYPYIDFDQVNAGNAFDPNSGDYRPIDVFLTNATMVTNGGGVQSDFFPEAYFQSGEFITKNRTDYQDNKDVALTPYSIETDNIHHILEYKQEKDKLVFTESFNRAELYYNNATNHGNGELAVHYDYLVTDFRLKVILRKNTGDDLVVTPNLNSYQLKFKVMK